MMVILFCCFACYSVRRSHILIILSYLVLLSVLCELYVGFLVGRPHFVGCGAFFAPPLLNMICYLEFYCHQMLFMYFQ